MRKNITKTLVALCRTGGVFLFVLWFGFGQTVATISAQGVTPGAAVSETVHPTSTHHPFDVDPGQIGRSSVHQQQEAIAGESGKDTLSYLSEDFSSGNGSAHLSLEKPRIKIEKEILTARETVRVSVYNMGYRIQTVQLFNPRGEMSTDISAITYGSSPQTITLTAKEKFLPGRYRLVIIDESGQQVQEEFSWGVVAINTNKSHYSVGDDVRLSLAVLDEVGEMVCDADIVLKIRDSHGNEQLFTSKDGTVIVNPQCYTTEETIVPDYQATYKATSGGLHNVTLTATSNGQSHTISDAFLVESMPDILPFSIERKSATRIFPPHTYPVTMTVTAREDFEGTITESVPASFDISQLPGVLSYSSETDVDVKKSIKNIHIPQLGNPYKDDRKVVTGFGQPHPDALMAETFSTHGIVGNDGIDVAYPENSGVLSVDEGKVVYSGAGEYGTIMVVEHSWGRSYYGFLSKAFTPVGTSVTKGQTIALSGSTGLSQLGSRLHFAIRPNEYSSTNGYLGKINPLPYLDTPSNRERYAKFQNSIDADVIPSGTKELRWNVSIKKGQTVSLGYAYNAPLISPELYFLGPLRLENEKGTIFEEGRRWQIAADSVVVTGGIVSSEVQFGGLQRKVAYVNSNWYAFYNDGTDVFWKKSSDGETWGSAQNLDVNEDNDADNYNPSIDVSGNFIHVFWMDESADQVQGLRLDTTSDTTTQTSVCGLTSPGAFTVSSYMVTVASLSASVAVVAYSDTSGGSNVDVFEVTGLDGATCSSTDVNPGNVIFGSGITASDRPVMVSLTSTTAMMVYTDGSNLKSAIYHSDSDEWSESTTTIAAISDSTYSVASDGTNVWVLSQNGTTATRLYKYPQASTGMVETSGALDTDVGASGDEQDNDVDITCPSATNCKIVYIDLQDNATPDLMFIDCDNADCSTTGAGTPRSLDADVGSATEHDANPAIFCLSSGANCKIVWGRNLDTTTPDLAFGDCNDDDCDTFSTNLVLNADLGETTTPKVFADIYCNADDDCQVVYLDNDSTSGSLHLADCSAANCSTTNSNAAIQTNINNAQTTAYNLQMAIWCVAAGDCRIVYQDGTNTDVRYLDCTAAACSGVTPQVIDSTIGGTATSVPMDIDCTGGSTDCKIIYADDTDTELSFIDCDNAACSSSTKTIIDSNAGNINFAQVSLDCTRGASDCVGTYTGYTASGSERLYFFDCDNATCTSGNVSPLPANAETRGAVSCPADDDCKMAYFKANGATPELRFADCTNDDCSATWESLTAPWTSETNVISLSLTYDSTNSDLVASIIKDSSEQAYYKVSDATTISWGSNTSAGFTAGDLDNISAPEQGAGQGEIGVLLRQGSNVEFDQLGSNPITFTEQDTPDINSSTDATSYASASWTPPTSGLIYVYVQSSVDAQMPVEPTISGNSLTWVLIHTRVSNKPNRLSLFAANASGSTTGATTISFGGRQQAHCMASFTSVTNVHLSDGVLNAFVQVQEVASHEWVDDGANGTSGTINMNAAEDSGNRPIAGFYHRANEASTHDADWTTEADDLSGSGLARSLSTAYDTAGFETNAAWTWTSSANYIGITAELRLSGTSVPNLIQTAFRVRSDDSIALNTDSGWEAALNANASRPAGQKFRIRFEVENNSGTTIARGYELWYSRNGASYLRIPDNEDPTGPIGVTSSDGKHTVQAVPSSAYTDGAATSSNILASSSTTYTNGTGEHNPKAASVSLTNAHTELEWTIFIHKLYDVWGHNADGTTFSFQVRRDGGGIFTSYTNTPTITLSNTVGYIGGSVSETPNRYMVVDGNKNIYYVTEGSDAHNYIQMMKSTDGGDSWSQVDNANSPEFFASTITAQDLEAVDVDLRGDTIYIAVQGSSADDAMFFTFNVSTHATTPDTWGLEEHVFTGLNDGVQKTAIARRGDSTTVMAYNGTVVSTKKQIYYKIRSSGGTWGTEARIDSTASLDVLGVSMIRDSTDRIYFVYVGHDGTSYKIYTRTLSTGDTLGSIVTVSNTSITTLNSQHDQNLTPPFVWTDGGTERVGVGYRKSDNKLYISTWAVGDTPSPSETVVSDSTIQWNQGGNNIPVADIVVDDATDNLHALFADNATSDIFYDTRVSGSWGTDSEEQDAVDADWIRAQLFTHSVANGSAKVVGYIWDNGSNGGTGLVYYDEKTLVSNTAPSAPTTLYTSESDLGATSGYANPVKVGDSTPIFSAVYVDPDTSDTANKYQIIVYSNSGCTTSVWDSGSSGTSMSNCTQGNRCADLNFGGTALSLDGSTYYWKIKYWDDDGAEGAFSSCTTDTFTMVSPTEQLKHGSYFFNNTTERIFTW